MGDEAEKEKNGQKNGTIQLTMLDVNLQGFVRAFEVMTNFNGFPTRTKYNMLRIRKQLKEQQELFVETYNSIQEKHMVEENGAKKVPKENLKERDKDLEELNEIPVEINHTPFDEKTSEDYIERMQLSPADMDYLEPFFTFPY